MKERAFKTVVGDIQSIVFAATSSQARHDTVSAAADAGMPIEYAHVRVTRAPEYDVREFVRGEKYTPSARLCYMPEMLESTT